jgi:hypothetical protein
LFRIDPGWPFVISGLALIVSAVLIPAQRELHDLEQRLKVHQAYEARAQAEILAYQQFMADLKNDATNERLLERLVRAQLNKMPKDERPLLLMPTANETVPTWIESSVTVEIPKPTPYADTLLSRIASGPRRLWVLATGAFLVFLGVMFAPTTFSSRRREDPAPALEDAQPEWKDSAGGVATLEQEDVECEAAETAQAEDVCAEDVSAEDAAEDVAEEALEDAGCESIEDSLEESREESREDGIEECVQASADAVVSISASSVMVEVDATTVSDDIAEDASGAIAAAGGDSVVAEALADVAVEGIAGEVAEEVAEEIADETADETADEIADETADDTADEIAESPAIGESIAESVETTLAESRAESREESDSTLEDVAEDAAAEVDSAMGDATADATDESPVEQLAETAVALAEPEPESGSAVEDEPPVCFIETYPSDFAEMNAGDEESLEESLSACETHEAPDAHELQYDSTDADAIDEPASDDTDSGESIVSAETCEPPLEPEPIEERSSAPGATDRALDSTSLFAGLDDTRWIDTRSGSPRGG